LQRANGNAGAGGGGILCARRVTDHGTPNPVLPLNH
jgi:hypothetical protein